MGTFFPVTVFVLLGLLLLGPHVPADLVLYEVVQDLTPEWQVVALSFATIVLTGLLYNLNIPLIRLYEGYPWRDSWLGEKRTGMHKSRFDAAADRLAAMRKVMDALDESKAEQKKQRNKVRVKMYGQLGIINSEFPMYEHLVLPTRLGNVIRNFETYPRRQYGIRAITFWPRLVSVIDAAYAAAIGDAKASFDFMLNSSALSGALALLILFAGLLFPVPLASASFAILWLLKIGLLIVAAYVFYSWSIGRARSWGNMVMGAFDLYRWDLLEQMGYRQKPVSRDEEKNVWTNIYFQTMFDDDPKTGPRLDYQVDSRPTRVSSQSSGVELAFLKALGRPGSNGVLPVFIQVRNKASEAASNTLVKDTLPEGYEYLWDSARVAGRTVSVSGANPYHFDIGPLKANEEIVLTYRAVQRGPVPERRPSVFQRLLPRFW